jgi:slit protein 2
VTIFFRTTQPEGVLLYLGQSQHWAVELFTGRVRVSYDVGNYPLSTMFSYEKVADGQVHRLELLAVKQNFTLKVDNGLARTIVNNGDKEYLEVSNPLYIGGVPPEIGKKATGSFHLRNATSLNG